MKLAARIILLLACVSAQLAFGQTYPTPIEHVIIIVQENRTPDNLFQDSNLINKGADIKKSTDPQAVPLASCWDVGHSHAAWVTDFGTQNNGTFCSSNISKCKNMPTCPQDTYVDNSTKVIQPYWDMAENYGFANYMFQTNEGPSYPAHQFLLSGTSAPVSSPTQYYNYFVAENSYKDQADNDVGCAAASGRLVADIDPSGVEGNDYTPPELFPVNAGFPCYEHHTLTDLLEAQGFTWKYFGHITPGSIWNAPNSIQHMCKATPGGGCTGSDWLNYVDLDDWDIFPALGTNISSGGQLCTLPAATWIIPDGNYSDHPKGQNQGGPDWVANIVDSLQNSKCTNPDGTSYWNSTAVIVTWDDWGGFYDHVTPYETVNNGTSWGSGYVSGFRVPLLVVSAYSPTPGYISGTPQLGGKVVPYIHDVGSILNFVEYAFGLPQGGISQTQGWFYDDYWAPDYYANGNLGCHNSALLCPYGLSDFFNFKQSPRPPVNIQPRVYQPNGFVNFSAFGGQSDVPDAETE
jgi:hypothetical protein